MVEPGDIPPSRTDPSQDSLRPNALPAGGENPPLGPTLAEFERSWEPGCLAERARALPLAGPARVAALWEMLKIDLRRQWQRGQKESVESYLRSFPELGNADSVPVDVIQTEIKARKDTGESVSWADYAHRFPRQTGLLERWLGQALQVPEGLQATDPGEPTVSGVDSHESSFSSTLRPADWGSAKTDPDRQVQSLTGEQFGPYKLLRILGSGQMGTVWLAEDADLPRQVALKVPQFSAEDPEALARFRREVQAVARLDHPNLCRIYQCGVVEGRPYFTMPYIKGMSLATYLRKHQPLPQRRAAEIAWKLALGLEEAHNSGVIHRDLKPSNVMMNQRGEPIIMDFGLARPLDGLEKLTADGAVLGTAAYMPPEQASGNLQGMGPGSDVYSLGVVLYELLTGQVPFKGALGQILVRIITEQPAPPSAHRPDLDPRLEQICLKAMARKLGDRYATMGEFAAALAGYLHDTAPAAAPPRSADLPAPPPPNPDGRWKAFALAGGALVLTGALVGFLLLSPAVPEAPVALVVRSSPAGAAVLIDGRRQQGLTDGTFQVSAGTHTVRLEMAGHEPVERTVEAATGQANVVVSAELKRRRPPPPATRVVRLDVTPKEATASVDGRPLTPDADGRFELPVGWHDLFLTREGYEPLAVKFEVKAEDGPEAYEYRLTPLLRTVVVRTDPVGAEVRIAGQTPRTSPAEYRLPVGRYPVQVSLKGYEPAARDLVVSAGPEPLQLSVPLTLLPGQKYALLVGVHSPGGGLPDFIHAEPDVVELGRAFMVAGYAPERVRVLTQTAGQTDPKRLPTAAVLRKELQRLADVCAPADSVVVALVGHHVRFEGDALSSFCPAKADLADRATLLPMAEVYEALGKCRAGTKLLLVDGWRQHWQKLAPPPLQQTRGDAGASLDPPAGLGAFFGCSAGEKSHEHPDLRNGVFFDSLVRGLQGAADANRDDRVTVTELVDYARARTAELTGKEQTPRWQGAQRPGPETLVRVEGALAHFNRGAEHLDRGRLLKGDAAGEEYRKAVEEFDRAAAVAPGYVDAYTSRAVAHYHQAKSDLAIKDCEQALALDPNDATALDYLGELQVTRGDFVNGLATLSRAVALDPLYDKVHSQRGWAYARRDDHKAAVAAFTEALACNPNLKEAYLNRGFSHYKLKDYQRAVKDEDQALHLDRNFYEAWYVRGLAHTGMKNYKEAVKDFGEVLRINPEYAPARTSLKTVQGRLKGKSDPP